MFGKSCVNMSAIVWCSSGVPYFRSSAYIWSSPVALLLLKLLKLFLTSSGVIGFFSGFDSPSNGVISSAVSSSNVRRLCPVCHLDLTRVFPPDLQL